MRQARDTIAFVFLIISAQHRCGQPQHYNETTAAFHIYSLASERKIVRLATAAPVKSSLELIVMCASGSLSTREMFESLRAIRMDNSGLRSVYLNKVI